MLVDPWTAVAVTALRVRGPNHGEQLAIPLGVPRLRSASPRVESIGRHIETATQDRQVVRGPLRGNEPKPYRLCFAKKAAAPFGMSRSS